MISHSMNVKELGCPAEQLFLPWHPHLFRDHFLQEDVALAYMGH